MLCGLSGGVDSTVVATLCHRAIGDRLVCVLVDHGLLREGEAEEVAYELGAKRGLSVVVVDARRRFLERLEGVVDPERKRKIIGAEFIAVFEDEARKHGPIEFLAQGTLYPDVIESASAGCGAQVIKTHHNVGGLPAHMRLKLVEPLRWLFKDEVRALGRELGLPDHSVDRHPFPGPGLAVRTLGAVNERDLDVLRARRTRSSSRSCGARSGTTAPGRPSPCCCRCTTVGVKGDERSYEKVIALRAVDSSDGMTADWTRLPASLLEPRRQPHRQRGARREPRRLRLHEQAARDDRGGSERGGIGKPDRRVRAARTARARAVAVAKRSAGDRRLGAAPRRLRASHAPLPVGTPSAVQPCYAGRRRPPRSCGVPYSARRAPIRRAPSCGAEHPTR